MSSRLLIASYRALLREARALTRAGQRLRFLEQPSLETVVQQYGRAAFIPPPSVRAAQGALFPGVDFTGYPSAEMTGAEVAALVKASFRAGGGGAAPHGGEGLQHLSALNTLRALAPCNSVSVTEVGESVRVETELATVFLPSLALGALAASERYTFSYRIRVTNAGSTPVQILGRHWQFFNARGDLMEVPRGSPGVVGHSPRIETGMSFEYYSGVSLTTPKGTMEGSFQMLAHEGRVSFDAHVARAELRAPT
jgi:ApaG protein